MSSLLLLEDEHASLEAALAFLDDYHDLLPDSNALDDLDLDLNVSCAALEFPATRQPESGLAVTCVQLNEKPKPTQPQRRQTALPNSTKSRVHKEVAAELHQQVDRLATRLSQLQKRRCAKLRAVTSTDAVRETTRLVSPRTASAMTKSRASNYYKDAMRELQRLVEAQKLNQTLRLAWKKEAKLAKRLKTLIQQLVALQEVASELQIESAKSTAVSKSLDVSPSLDVLELLGSLVGLFYQASLVSTSINLRDTSRVFSSSHVHDDHLLGQTIEITTNSPLGCSLRELDEHMTSYLGLKQNQSKRHTAGQEGRVSTSLCYEQRFTQQMECQYGTIRLSSVAVARKFDEPDRHVFVYTSRMATADSKLTFQMDAWFIMTERRNSAGGNEALLQTFCRIHRVGTTCRTLENASYFQDFILTTKSDELREKLLCFQSRVLGKFGSPP